MWDKYQLSYEEIDKQLKQSEKVMSDYLEKLGYESKNLEEWGQIS